MGKSFTLIQTVTTAGAFSAVSFWYGFMFGRESARKELDELIENLRRGNTDSAASSPPHS
ncbi:uncharacterized protein LOC121267471 [Juglans microcarpa x Juglans regia]|uniref:Uncharacterized protein LOC118348240 n=1 Tax=Juglans regia TaxID=51240 RepID=A0A6P9ERQ0_JUGRE|nr:uncharacterized protein LOC118348240 [Juglans regia]XP_035545253.1 uncharacterized protein LOC118348240 [Juglans regia]XP_035545254.1 uncharacterized protein LOC118348240 [Juglans regia]XP_041027277.1 uncharacterized protein LOC121267471 [Juglans microcarpa x Juglans regia]XP_041027278.1 uncharacterized protein LOC121267471 [Juglans microcarpa x Juglans regia]